MTLTGRTPVDPNRRAATFGISSVDGTTTVPIEVNPSTGRLLVDSSGGGSAGTQYAEGVTTSPATGTAALGRYIASPSALSDGQMAMPLLDSLRRLQVVSTGTTTVSGTVTANAGTNLNTSALALESGGNLATIVTNTTSIATAANQTTGNSSLSTIVTNTTGLATSANQTNGNQQAKITDGTAVANTFAGDTGFNGLNVGNSIKTVTFTTTTVQAVGTTDAANYPYVAIQVNTQGTNSVVAFQTSNDNSTYFGQALQLSSSTNGSSSTQTSTGPTTGLYYGSTGGRYFRLNVTGISAGTTAGVIVFSSTARGLNSFLISAAQSGTWTVQPGNTANTTPWLATINQGGTSAAVTAGNALKVEQVFSYSNLATNATTTVKSGAGYLHTLVINTKGTATTATIYDNTAGSGTKIATVDTTLSTTAFVYDVSFATGLTVVTAGTTPADLTVSYR